MQYAISVGTDKGELCVTGHKDEFGASRTFSLAYNGATPRYTGTLEDSNGGQVLNYGEEVTMSGTGVTHPDAKYVLYQLQASVSGFSCDDSQMHCYCQEHNNNFNDLNPAVKAAPLNYPCSWYQAAFPMVHSGYSEKSEFKARV